MPRWAAYADDRRAGVARIGAVLVTGVVAAVVATTMDTVVVVSLIGGIGLALVGLRWPLVPLLVFVALVPFEDTAVLPGVGTLSRACAIVFAGVYAIPRIGRLVPGALPLAGWAFVAWAAFSLTWAVDPVTARGPLETLIQLAVIAFLIADVVIRDSTVVRLIVWVYSLSAAASAAIGIAAYVGGSVDVGARLAAIGGQNPAQFASLLLPAFIFGLHELANRRRPVVSGLVTLLCMAGIVLSGTRSVWVAAVVTVFLLLLPRLGARRGVLALGVSGVLALAAVQVPSVASLVIERAETATATGGAGRTDIWAVGARIFESSPAIGIGYGNFPVAFASMDFSSANIRVTDLTFFAPHSLVVGTAAELGAIGVALLALFVLPLVVRRGWGPDALLVQAILASLLIDALFIDIFGYRKQVWIAIGLACGLAYLARHARRGAVVSAAGAESTPARPWATVLAPVRRSSYPRSE